MTRNSSRHGNKPAAPPSSLILNPSFCIFHFAFCILPSFAFLLPPPRETTAAQPFVVGPSPLGNTRAFLRFRTKRSGGLCLYLSSQPRRVRAATGTGRSTRRGRGPQPHRTSCRNRTSYRNRNRTSYRNRTSHTRSSTPGSKTGSRAPGSKPAPEPACKPPRRTASPCTEPAPPRTSRS